MQNPFSHRKPTRPVAAIQDTIRRALAAAGLDTTTGPMRDLTETLRRALGGDSAPGHAPSAKAARGSATIIDVEARVVDPAAESAARTASAQPAQPKPHAPRKPAGRSAKQPLHTPGTFEQHSFTNDAGTRNYKLHVPADQGPAPAAMVVMLHGCTQSPDDFAAGTRMNQVADENGFLVLYPEQPSSANQSRCWNWFKREDQQRNTGEPALLAGMVRDVATRHGVDPRRIFVAGLSAGAAMAVILGETYPELFAGVGAHSGLPYASAHDVSSALVAMKGGRSGIPGLTRATAADGAARKATSAVPLIVFHGDRDHTVQQANGASIVQQAQDAHAAAAGQPALQASTQEGTASGGQRYTRTVLVDAQGRTCIESWTLHGAGHAWSGGDASGSYTDARGPDASTEMARFFLTLPPAGSA